MTEGTAEASRTARSVAGHGFAVAGGWYLTAVVCFALWVGALPASNPPGVCDGIGFGCTTNPRDGALIGAVFFGMPALLVAVAISAGVLLGMVAAGVRSGLVAGNTAAAVGLGAVTTGCVVLVLR